ncbi:MAG: Sbal_3080 family lipoprotein [Pseudomonadota bacterium]
MKHITALGLALVVGACTISQTVTPVAANRIDTLCVEENQRVAQAGFEPALIRQINGRGVATRRFSGEVPPDCRHVLSYTANWRWDFALYLVYAELTVTEGRQQVAQAIYDAKSGGLNFDKFGPTEEKLRVLVAELLPQS